MSMMNSASDRRAPCTYCGARPSEHCRDNQGDYVDWNHAVRIADASNLAPTRMLLRIEQLEQRVAELEAARERRT